MEVKFGTTRIVILVGDKAIKIARIRLVRCLFRILTFPFCSQNNHRRFYKKYGRDFKKALIRYIFFGFYANLIEYKFYNNHKDDPRIVPTIRCLFMGFVIVQIRGHCISSDIFENNNPFKGLNNLRYQEVHGYWQFCEIKQKVLLADYGHKETCKFLIRSFI